MNAPFNHQEVVRLSALDLDVDAQSEVAFVDLVQLAAQICQMPVAAIQWFDRERSWIQAAWGLDLQTWANHENMAPLYGAWQQMRLIPDTWADSEVAQSLVVTEDPYLRAYAGVPLVTTAGQAIGLLWVADSVPHTLAPVQIDALQGVSRQVIHLFELRHQVAGILSDRQRTEELLWETQKRLQHLLASSPVVIYSCKPAGDYAITFISENITTLFGYQPQTFLQDAHFWFDRIHPDDVGSVLQQIAYLLHQGHHAYEYRFLHQDGNYRWMYNEMRVIYSESGQPIELVGSWQDITERKEAEAQILEQALLLDKAQDAILVIDMAGRIQFWNQSAVRLLGWTAPEAINQFAHELLWQPSPQLDAAYQMVKVHGEWHGELQLSTQNQREVLVESRWTLVQGTEKTLQAILIVNTDITEKKLLERQFLRAQRMESIGTLAGGIAHDLNNVLAPILMSVQLLTMRTTDPQCQQWLEILETSTRRGANLVKQVLSFARGVEGERIALELQHLLWEICQIVEETFPKSIELKTEIPRDLWPILGDATQLHQVLMNLCVNARDAMLSGGELTITAMNQAITERSTALYLDAVPGTYVMVTVRDTGIGVPAAILDRIFEPFFTTKELGKGTGLGLSTAMGIIKSHGGFLHVSSRVGWGTEFRVFLPAIALPVPPEEKLSLLPAGHGELILLVDDEVAIREIAQQALETCSYQVLTASDGIEAIALYAQHRREIAVVLVDMMMPAMDGTITIRALRKMNPDLKIVAMSGLSSLDRVPELTSIGAQSFLPKPFTTPELLAVLQDVLEPCEV